MSTRQHWLVDVLRQSGFEGANIPASLPTNEAWAYASFQTGLNPGQLAEKVASHFHIGIADMEATDSRILKLIPEKIARRYVVFPLAEDDRRLYVATSDPANLEAERELGFASGRSIVFRIVPPAKLLDTIEKRYAPHNFGGRVPGTGEPQSFAPPSKPAASSRSARDQTDQAPAANQADQPHVLLVDDEDVNRHLARSILEKLGYRVSEAKDGIAAIDMIMTGTAFTLIILDLEMPHLGGREVLARLKKSTPHSAIPVMVLTGTSDESMEAQLMEDGAEDYLRKPIDSARFIARVRAVLRRTAS